MDSCDDFHTHYYDSKLEFGVCLDYLESFNRGWLVPGPDKDTMHLQATHDLVLPYGKQ